MRNKPAAIDTATFRVVVQRELEELDGVLMNVGHLIAVACLAHCRHEPDAQAKTRAALSAVEAVRLRLADLVTRRP